MQRIKLAALKGMRIYIHLSLSVCLSVCLGGEQIFELLLRTMVTIVWFYLFGGVEWDEEVMFAYPPRPLFLNFSSAFDKRSERGVA